MKRKQHDNPELQEEYRKRKYKENPELKKEYQKKKNQVDKKVFIKVENLY